VLDAIGAMVVAAERGVETDELHWRRDRALGLAASSQLAHRVGVNGFFCDLLGAARGRPGTDLAAGLVAGAALPGNLGRGRAPRRLRRLAGRRG